MIAGIISLRRALDDRDLSFYKRGCQDIWLRSGSFQSTQASNFLPFSFQSSWIFGILFLNVLLPSIFLPPSLPLVVAPAVLQTFLVTISLVLLLLPCCSHNLQLPDQPVPLMKMIESRQEERTKDSLSVGQEIVSQLTEIAS